MSYNIGGMNDYQIISSLDVDLLWGHDYRRESLDWECRTQWCINIDDVPEIEQKISFTNHVKKTPIYIQLTDIKKPIPVNISYFYVTMQNKGLRKISAQCWFRLFDQVWLLHTLGPGLCWVDILSGGKLSSPFYYWYGIECTELQMKENLIMNSIKTIIT